MTLTKRYGKLIDVERDFGFNEAVDLTGVTRSQLIHWSDKQLIVPSVAQTTGRGVPRRYSFEDLVLVRLAVVLVRDFGFPLSMLGRFLAPVRWAARRGADLVVLWGTDGTTFPLSSGDVAEIQRALAGTQNKTGLVLDIAAAREWVRARGATE